MISTKARAVSGPAPGWVIRRCASRQLLYLLLDCLAELCNGGVQPIQQFHKIAPSPTCPGGQLYGFQLLSSTFSPQPLLAALAFVQGYGLQLVHDPGARLHHAMSVPQQLP